MLYFAVAIELLVIVFLSYGVERLWVKHINNRFLRILLFPGSVAHVLSHAILCLITGATIRNLNIFRFENNEVQFERPRIKVVGNFLIAAAPIFGCGVAILFLAKFLGSSVNENQHIPNNIGWYDNVRSLSDSIKITLLAFWREINDHKAYPLLFIFLSIIFTVSMAPKREEFKFLILGLIVLAAIPFSIEMYGVSLRNNYWWGVILNWMWRLITLSVSVLSAILCITLIIIGIFTGFRLTFSSKGKARKMEGNKTGSDKTDAEV